MRKSLLVFMILLPACASVPKGPYWSDPEWQQSLSNQISTHLLYPEAGWKEGFPSGSGTVHFTYRDGKLQDAKVVDSTGSLVLDKALITGIERTPPPPVSAAYASTAHDFDLALELKPSPEDFRDFLNYQIASDTQYPDDQYPSQAAIIYVDGTYVDGKISSLSIRLRQGGTEDTSTVLLAVLNKLPLPSAPPSLKGASVPVSIRFCISVDAYFCLKNSLANFQWFHGVSISLDPVPAPPKDVKALLDKAMQGDVVSQMQLGKMYEAGERVPTDMRKAIYWERKAALQNNPQAQDDLNGLYYRGGGVPAGDGGLIGYFTAQAEAGAPDAQAFLGAWYEGYPENVIDYSKAIPWIQKAADQHYGRAESQLGFVYKNGYGVTQDSQKALPWLERAAADGYYGANNGVASIYERGIGVKQDFEKAAAAYRNIPAGNWSAMCNLYRLHIEKGISAASPAEQEAWDKITKQDMECLNWTAWILSTSSEQTLRDPHKALELINIVLDEKGKRWDYLDTLAAAQAADGDFTDAVATERDAIGKRKFIDQGADSATTDAMNTRLINYMNHQPDIEIHQLP